MALLQARYQDALRLYETVRACVRVDVVVLLGYDFCCLLLCCCLIIVRVHYAPSLFEQGIVNLRSNFADIHGEAMYVI